MSLARRPSSSRRLRQAALFAAVTLLVLGGGVLHRLVAQQSMDEVQIKTQHVAGNIYMLEGRGGNIGVSAGADGLLMVDDQYAPLAPKIQVALEKLDKGELEFLLNTHYHGDHVGGNATFGVEAPIIAHDNVRVRLVSGYRPFGRPPEPQPKEALPVITFDESVTIHFNDEKIEVIHFPEGHTDGDSIIFFTGSNVVHMGDHLFVDSFPFVDLGAGGNVLGLVDNVAEVLERIPADARVIPGHGPLADVESLRRYHDTLTETIEIVRRRRAEGKSLEEIQEAGLPARFDSWGGGFIKTPDWLEFVYRSLEARGS
jgi:glyoxylase-like metal-dependent hydrolase (beta-lactamase superfamily II)